MYWRLSLLLFLHFFVWGSWFVTAGTYLMKNLQFSGSDVGMVYSTSAIAATLSPLLVGILADRYFPVEKILGVLYACGGGLLWWMSSIDSFGYFYILILLYMLLFLPAFSLANAYCFHQVQDARFDYPKIRIWGTIAWIMAGIMVSILDLEDKAGAMQIAGSISFILSVYAWFLPSAPPTVTPGGSFLEFLKGPEISKLWSDRSFKVLIICVAFICIPTSYYYSFVNPFLNEMGVENAALKMSVGQVTEILMMLLLPFIFRTVRLKVIIFVGLFLWGVRYLFFVMGIDSGTEFWYIIGLLVHGAAYIFSTLTAQIYLDLKVPKSLRSTAQGFYSLLTFGIGAFVGSIIAGNTVSYFTLADGNHAWKIIWWIPSIVGILVAFCFLFYFKSKEKA